MYKIKGKIIFDPINVTRKHKKQSSWKKVVIIKFDGDIDQYYSWYIHKIYGIRLNKPLRGSHVTIINDIVDDEIYLQAKEIFDGKEISVEYDPEQVRTNDKHWWINVKSEDSENIRVAMGLNPYPYFGFHLTLGLASGSQLEQSKYIHRCITRKIIN